MNEISSTTYVSNITKFHLLSNTIQIHFNLPINFQFHNTNVNLSLASLASFELSPRAAPLFRLRPYRLETQDKGENSQVSGSLNSPTVWQVHKLARISLESNFLSQ